MSKKGHSYSQMMGENRKFNNSKGRNNKSLNKLEDIVTLEGDIKKSKNIKYDKKVNNVKRYSENLKKTSSSSSFICMTKKGSNGDINNIDIKISVNVSKQSTNSSKSKNLDLTKIKKGLSNTSSEFNHPKFIINDKTMYASCDLFMNEIMSSAKNNGIQDSSILNSNSNISFSNLDNKKLENGMYISSYDKDIPINANIFNSKNSDNIKSDNTEISKTSFSTNRKNEETIEDPFTRELTFKKDIYKQLIEKLTILENKFDTQISNCNSDDDIFNNINKKFSVCKRISNEFSNIIPENKLLFKLSSCYNDIIYTILNTYEKVADKIQENDAYVKNFKNITKKYNELFKRFEEKSSEVKKLKSIINDNDIKYYKTSTEFKKINLNKESICEDLDKNENNKTRMLNMIKKNVVNDLDAIYFFDKIDMRSNSSKNKQIPKLDLKFIESNVLKSNISKVNLDDCKKKLNNSNISKEKSFKNSKSNKSLQNSGDFDISKSHVIKSKILDRNSNTKKNNNLK